MRGGLSSLGFSTSNKPVEQAVTSDTPVVTTDIADIADTIDIFWGKLESSAEPSDNINHIIPEFVKYLGTLPPNTTFKMDPKDVRHNYDTLHAAIAIGAVSIYTETEAETEAATELREYRGGETREEQMAFWDKYHKMYTDMMSKKLEIRQNNQNLKKVEQVSETIRSTLATNEDLFKTHQQGWYILEEEANKRRRAAFVVFYNNIQDLSDIMSIVSSIHTFVNAIDPYSLLFLCSDNVLSTIVKFVIFSFGFGKEQAIISALTGGIDNRIGAETSVSINTLRQRLLVSAPFTELLLCSIINKKHPKYVIYNACLWYFISTSTKPLAPLKTQLFTLLSDADKKNIQEESTYLIQQFVTNKVENNFFAGYADIIPKIILLFEEVIQGLLLRIAYCSMCASQINIVDVHFKNSDFTFTIESLTRAVATAFQTQVTAADVPQFVNNECFVHLQSIMQTGIKTSPPVKMHNLYIGAAHGAVLRQLNGESVENGIVPDNVILVKVGIVGDLTSLAYGTDTQDCKVDLNQYVVYGEISGNACDILPPGCAYPMLQLTGDKTPGRTGMRDCSNDKTLVDFELRTGKLLSEVLQIISESTKNSGQMALVCLACCQQTNDVAKIITGNNANRHAALRLSPEIKYFGSITPFHPLHSVHQAALKRKQHVLASLAKIAIKSRTAAAAQEPAAAAVSSQLRPGVTRIGDKRKHQGGGNVNRYCIATLLIATIISAIVPELF